MSVLSDDKTYTSIQEVPEGEEEEKKEGGLFPDGEEEDADMDDADDKRSIQSEEAMKPEEGMKALSAE